MKASYHIKQFVATLVFFAIIFFSAGRFDYWQGQIYVIIGLAMFLLSCTVFSIDVELIRERAKPGKDTKKWDKLILGLSFLAMLLMYIVAGFDSGRMHWSPDFNWSICLLGIIFTVLGQLLFLIAQKQNKFFSSTVRIQTDREHVVCKKGLYKWVRHPAYLGSIIQLIGFPLLLNSLWSIIPVLVSIVLQITRTYLEDKTLMKELPGYQEYSLTTRYRILPFVW